jgi:cadmium resistance protein CadD (predicted permease)
MHPVAADLGVGIVAFIATNIDDIFLLGAFFSDRRLRPASVVAGQYLGNGLLVLASALAAMLSLAIPEGWVALLGFIPLLMGIKGLVDLRDDEDEQDERRQQEQAVERRTRSAVIAVAAVTIANGGDNVGVYVPLFASDVPGIAIYVLTFAVMTGAWCLAGYWLVNNAFVGEAIRRRAHVALPVVLILLGLYIVWDARVLLQPWEA